MSLTWIFIIVTILLTINKWKRAAQGTLSEEMSESDSEEFSQEYDEEAYTSDNAKASEDYFTYETIDEEPKSQTYTSKVSDAVPEPAAMSADKVGEDSVMDFDLRQAVIYQTILHNDYLGNENNN